MTTITHAAQAPVATRNFMEDRTEGRSFAFGDMDSTVHALIDQADIAGDGKSIYEMALPRGRLERHAAATARDANGAGEDEGADFCALLWQMS